MLIDGREEDSGLAPWMIASEDGNSASNKTNTDPTPSTKATPNLPLSSSGFPSDPATYMNVSYASQCRNDGIY